MKVTCKSCKRKVETENINVSKDVAFCKNCETITALSSLVADTPNQSFNSNTLEKGTNFTSTGTDWVAEASYRSYMAIFLVPFTMVWAGGSLSGIYGSQIIKGEFNLESSLFGIPFLLGSIVLVTVCLLSVFGRTLVSRESNEGLVFIGIGDIGWYRRFPWRDVDRVVEINATQNSHLALEGTRRITFGWGLSSKKRFWLANMVRSKLV